MKATTKVLSAMMAVSLISVSGAGFAAETTKAHAKATKASAKASTVPAGTYEIDAVHSKVGFEVPHLVISTVEGKFNQFSGQIVAGEKSETIATNVEIQTTAIDTANADRDKHLKSPDFFDAEKFPKMTFTSDKIIFKGSTVKIPGQLTIKGVTKPVTLEGKYLGTVKGMMGEDRMAAQLATKIKRKDFGLNWNKMIEAGPVVGDDVAISLKIEAVRKM